MFRFSLGTPPYVWFSLKSTKHCEIFRIPCYGNGTGTILPIYCTEDSESSAQLLRTKSDAAVLRRGQRRSPSDQRKIRRHRFSINGHFYNHKVALSLDPLKIMPSCTFLEFHRPGLNYCCYFHLFVSDISVYSRLWFCH